MPLVSCGKKNFPFLSLWRCWAAHYSCGYFNACGNTEKCTHRAPLWPPSLWNKNKINTLLGRDLTKAKGFLFFIFRQVSWQRKRQAWLSMGRNAICESQCWCLTWAKLQTGITDSKFFITLGSHVYLTNFWLQHTLHLRNFLTLHAANTIYRQWKFALWSYHAVLHPAYGFLTITAKRIYKPPCVFILTSNEKAAHCWCVKKKKIYKYTAQVATELDDTPILQPEWQTCRPLFLFQNLIPQVCFAKWVELTSSLLAGKFVLTLIFMYASVALVHVGG